MSNRNWNNDRPHLLKAVCELNASGKSYNHNDVFEQINNDTSHSLFIVKDHLSFTDKPNQRTQKATGTELDRSLKASNGRVYLSDGPNRYKAADIRRSQIDAAGLQLNHEPHIIALGKYTDVKGKAKGDSTLERNEPCTKIYVKYDGGLHNKQITEQMTFKLPTSNVTQLKQPIGWRDQAMSAKANSRGFDDILLAGNHDRFSLVYSAIEHHSKWKLQRTLEKMLPKMKKKSVRRELGYNRARGDGKPSIAMCQAILKITPELNITLSSAA